MAITKFPTYVDPITSGRQPTVGDIRCHTDYKTWEDVYEIFDGVDWQRMNGMGNTVASKSLTAIPSPAGNFTAVSNAATTIKNDVVTMIEKNIRVAEVYDSTTQKLKRAELQFREGPGSIWEPIQRVKLYE